MTLPKLAQLWELSPSYPNQDVSFDTQAQANAETAIWKFDLPEAISTAERELQYLESEIQSTKMALEEIPLQIERIGHMHLKATSGELSFQSQDVKGADWELFTLLGELSPLETGLSFDYSGKTSQNLKNAVQEFENSFNRIKSVLTLFALVETSIAGKVIGRTRVSWTGKTESSWQLTGGVEQFHLHQRSLQAALASRYLLLNMLLISAQGAVKLSALLAIPGGAIMALPAVWKYITHVMKELEKYQRLTRQGVQ
jgi:hypothetical protein